MAVKKTKTTVTKKTTVAKKPAVKNTVAKKKDNTESLIRFILIVGVILGLAYIFGLLLNNMFDINSMTNTTVTKIYNFSKECGTACIVVLIIYAFAYGYSKK